MIGTEPNSGWVYGAVLSMTRGWLVAEVTVGKTMLPDVIRKKF
jgi:hypothetical protein